MNYALNTTTSAYGNMLNWGIGSNSPHGPFFQGKTWAPGEALITSTVQTARARFVSKMRGDTGETLLNLVERKQAITMMTKRSLQLFTFCNALRRLRFDDAATALGIKRSDPRMKSAKLRRSSHAFANNYLEFHFGWSPLVNDIYSAVKILQSDVPSGVIKGRHKDRINPGVITAAGPYEWANYTHDTIVRALVQAEIRITNPNLYLANKLGLVNPVSVAWEAIPFSFVLGWFVNVSDFLGSWSEQFGVEVIEPFYTVHVQDRYGYESRYPNAPYPGGQVQRVDAIANSTVRTRGLPSVALVWRRPWTLSVRRGLAAVSLLIQQGLNQPSKPVNPPRNRFTRLRIRQSTRAWTDPYSSS
jgi:hypothetical protein